MITPKVTYRFVFAYCYPFSCTPQKKTILLKLAAKLRDLLKSANHSDIHRPGNAKQLCFRRRKFIYLAWNVLQTLKKYKPSILLWNSLLCWQKPVSPSLWILLASKQLDLAFYICFPSNYSTNNKYDWYNYCLHG